MISISEISGKQYHDEDCVFFRNYVQAAHYCAWAGMDILVDLFVDSENKFVYVFKKETHNLLKDRWRDNKNRQDCK